MSYVQRPMSVSNAECAGLCRGAHAVKQACCQANNLSCRCKQLVLGCLPFLTAFKTRRSRSDLARCYFGLAVTDAMPYKHSCACNGRVRVHSNSSSELEVSISNLAWAAMQHHSSRCSCSEKSNQAGNCIISAQEVLGHRRQPTG